MTHDEDERREFEAACPVVAYGYENTRPTERAPLMMVALSNTSDQYPELATELVRKRDVEAWRAARAAARHAEPIDMVLYCPACGMQHVDAVEPSTQPDGMFEGDEGWDNPPHRSHLCHGCGCIWRPADVPTNGVASIKTRGKADSPPTTPPAQRELTDEEIVDLVREVGLDWHQGYSLEDEPNRYVQLVRAALAAAKGDAP